MISRNLRNSKSHFIYLIWQNIVVDKMKMFVFKILLFPMYTHLHSVQNQHLAYYMKYD